MLRQATVGRAVALLPDEVELVLFHQHLPVLVYLLADNIAVAAKLVIPKLTLVLVVVLVCQTASHVANFHRTQTVNEAHGQKEASTGPAAGITVGLFQTVVLLVLSCLGVVS